MATVNPILITTSTTDSNNYVSGAFTPTAGDILVIFVVAPDTTTSAATLTSSIGGQTYSRITTVLKNSSADRIYAFVSDFKATAVSQTVTFDCGADAATGILIAGLKISGMELVGLAAIKQIISQNNQSGGTTPSITFPFSVLTGNPTVGVIGNGTNPASMTPPTNWADAQDYGISSPSAGIETVYRNSGFNQTTVTWGSTSSSPFGSILIELAAMAVNVTWLEVEKFIAGSSNKVIGSITGSASGIQHKLYISWLEIQEGAPSNGTSNKIIGSITGYASAAQPRFVQVAWLEIEKYETSTGTSNEVFEYTGTSDGTHQNLLISWLELELVPEGVDSGSDKIIALLGGTAAGSSPWLTTYGTSNKTIGTIIGTATGVVIKVQISWIKLETVLGNVGNSVQTISISGTATSIRPTINASSNKTVSVNGTATGEKTYSVISWLKIENILTNIGSSSKTFTISGSIVGDTLVRRFGTSNKNIATISRTSIGKIKVIGISNKVIAVIILPNQVWQPSLRVYVSPIRNYHFVTPARNFHFISETRTYQFSSPNRTVTLEPDSRTNSYITPTRIGI
jgi:hypothetical protein